MMNKTLLKKMVSEVSVPTLCAFIVEYSQAIVDQDEAGEDYTDNLASLDTLTAELKGRKSSRGRQRKPRQENAPEEKAEGSNDEQKHIPSSPPPAVTFRAGGAS